MVDVAGRVRGVLHELSEDVATGAQHLLLVTVGGSVLVLRSGRKWLYRLAGAGVASAPGAAFMFSGSPANLVVGTDVYFNQRVFVEAKGRVRIGSGTAVGTDVLILSSHHDVDPAGVWSVTAVGRAVDIGEHVWLGARTVVLPGAVIEDGGTVVAGRLESGGLYAGVPARRVSTSEEDVVGGTLARLRGVAATLGEDARAAGGHLLLVAVGGSSYLHGPGASGSTGWPGRGWTRRPGWVSCSTATPRT